MIIAFLILDAGYSFLQFYNTPLDGDMAAGILPSPDVQKILNDPFGATVLWDDSYPNPNRYFSHKMFKEYFEHVPLALQRFTDPINSVYLSSGFIKLAIHLCIIYLVSAFSAGSTRVLSRRFLMTTAIVTPLLQTNGFNRIMGVIDQSVTYTFFYALPLVFLLWFLLPLFLNWKNERIANFPKFKIVGLILLSILMSLSGPLNPGIIVVLMLTILFYQFSLTGYIGAINFVQNRRNWLLIFAMLVSLYSLFIGSFNSLNEQPGSTPELIEVYSRMPGAIWQLFSNKIGLPILTLMSLINWVIIKRNFNNKESRRLVLILKWIAIFSILYILVLPLGGYRSYRPDTLRYDTFLPISLVLMYAFASTSLFLIEHVVFKKSRIVYTSVCIAVGAIFTFADFPEFDKNKCERMALKNIADSKESIVELNCDCSVLYWGKVFDPKDSNMSAELLKMWRVTPKAKLYYQK